MKAIPTLVETIRRAARIRLMIAGEMIEVPIIMMVVTEVDEEEVVKICTEEVV